LKPKHFKFSSSWAVTWVLRLEWGGGRGGEGELILPNQKGVSEVVPDGHFARKHTSAKIFSRSDFHSRKKFAKTQAFDWLRYFVIKNASI
jgi:hypothetical protein